MKHWRTVPLILFIMLALSVASAANEVTYRSSSLGEDVPSELAPGYTVFTTDSDAGTSTSVTVFRLLEGSSPEAFAAASERVDAAFSGEGDVAEAINHALSLAELIAEIYADAGERESVGVVLEPGDYLFEITVEEGERSYHPFTVAGERQAEAPEADLTVHMVDFAFAMPPGIRAGEQLWEVINSGQQLHHMIVFRLNEGASEADFMSWMESEEGPPPGEDVAYISLMGSGQRGYYTLTLEPGNYVAICFMPDHLGDATGMPHFALGMMQSFTIED